MGTSRLNEVDECFDKALQINPRNSEALNNKGNVCFQNGDHDEAIVFYDRSIDVNPNDAIVHLNKGAALAASNHLTEAIDSVERAISINSNFAEAYFTLAKIKHELLINDIKLKDRPQPTYEEVVLLCDRALGLKSDFALAYYEKGLALKKHGRLGDIEQCRKKLLELNRPLADEFVEKLKKM